MVSTAQRSLLGALFALLLAYCTPCGAENLGLSLEAEAGILAKLQVAYLFNIARYVTWPRAEGAVHLCLASNSALARYAHEVDGHDLDDGRKLEVLVTPADLSRCQILFIRRNEDTAVADPRGAGPGVLIVSDRPDAVARGYAMQFFVHENSLHFAVNADIMAGADYRVSSKLMRLAKPLPN